MSRSAILKQIPGCGSSAVGEDGLPPILLYHYTETRAKFHAASFLHGFHGYLETDGYQGYNNLPDIKRCSCWAHVRRYFTDAIPKGKEYDYTFRQCREYNSAPGCLIVSGTQKQKIILRSRENSSVMKRRSRYWRHSGIAGSTRPNKGTRLAKAVNYAKIGKTLT